MWFLNSLIKVKIIKIDFIRKMIQEKYANKFVKSLIVYSLLKRDSDLKEIQNIYDDICKINFKSFENVIFYNLFQALTTCQINSFYQYKNLLFKVSTEENISISFDFDSEYLLLRKKINLICEDLSYNIKVDVKKYFI